MFETCDPSAREGSYFAGTGVEYFDAIVVDIRQIGFLPINGSQGSGQSHLNF